MSGLDWAGALTITGVVACIFVAAAVLVRRLSADSERPGQFGYLTYEPEDEPGDEQPLADEVAAWLAREDFR